jgi:hypothetical protein
MNPVPNDDEIKLFQIPSKRKPADFCDYLKVEDLPQPFSPGPFKLEGNDILALNGNLVAEVEPIASAPANGHLLASAWELYTMLVEYLSTDHCTSHPEGETCRFCVSLNVIRRALGTPDEVVPVLTYFAQFKEQRAIKEAYQKRYEAFRARVGEVALYAEERIFKLRAQIDTLEKQYPERAEVLAKGLSELMVVKVMLEK